jgi:hypothetical protein
MMIWNKKFSVNKSKRVIKASEAANFIFLCNMSYVRPSVGPSVQLSIHLSVGPSVTLMFSPILKLLSLVKGRSSSD